MQNVNKINMQIKIMHKHTSEGRYFKETNEDFAKLIPKSVRITKMVESIILLKEDEQTEETMLAAATKLNAFYVEYHKIEEWHTAFAITNNKRGSSSKE